MRRIGLELVAEKKAAILRERYESKEKEGGVERKDIAGRDLLTLLLKANMATDIPENQRLSDEDVLARTWAFLSAAFPCADQPCRGSNVRRFYTSCGRFTDLCSFRSFLVAGHETTSTATTWCLFALTQAPEVQKKLRAELLTLDTDTPNMDELSNLPYLDMVVRETLRIHAPVPSTMRVAMKDDVIPVAEPFVDHNGVVQDSIRYLCMIMPPRCGILTVSVKDLGGYPDHHPGPRSQPVEEAVGRGRV